MVKIADSSRFHGLCVRSSEEFWRENIHGGFATLVAVLFVFACYCAKRFFFGKPSGSSASPVGLSDSDLPTSGSWIPSHSTLELVTDADLKFLIDNLGEKTGENEKWEKVIDKRNDILSYYAKCCKPKDSPLTYLSVTIFENCSPEKLRDFYMDNDYRKQWDKMLIQHEQLQMDKNKGVEVGRTIKKFPLLTAREYVLAWRLWEGKDNTFYCFIKECEHPLAPRQKKYVRVSTFRSGWRIRKVPDTNACEIKMFHQEDAGLNVEMAKLAFSRGIWSYVCKMGNALNRYTTISSHQSRAAASAVTLIKKVHPVLEATDDMTSQATSVGTSVCRPIAGEGRKLSRRPSKKLLANGLLLLGGVVCLSRGHSSLGAKVAIAYILAKWSKRGASSSQSSEISVSALNVMYNSLQSRSKLSGWKSSGGDPCGDSWKGITCSGSSVTQIDLSDLGLSGSMGYQLASLTSVTKFDLSKNNLNGDIPYQLPPNAKYIDLSQNGFSNTVPYSVSQMSDLETLNLGRNKLNGQLSDMFGKLTKLKELDLSYNSLTGNLPQSFGKLSSLKKLYLQNNQLTGQINVLMYTPVEELNIENNRFSGWIPNDLKGINIKSGGNSWSSGPSPPSPPGAHRNRGSGKKSGSRNSSVVTGVTIAGIALAVLLLLAIIIALFSRKKRSSTSHLLDDDRLSQRKSFRIYSSKDLSKELTSDYKDSAVSIDIKPVSKSPSIGFKSLSGRLQSFARRSTSVKATAYALADLQVATANFAPARLLGQGTIGRVYRAKYSDGKVLAVKKIDSSLFQGSLPQEFSDIVINISKIRHANIAELVGYCSEHGHNMLIYEYFRNGSLHEFLHMSDDYSNPLTWNTRVRIALGAARAVEYLHDGCSPSTVHKNIKSSNIFLDIELNPRLCDYGLATFHQRTSQNLGMGYNAPECTKPSAFTGKSDVYSFGVVMLELLTGRMPVDSSKPPAEQCLVRWATPQLHDLDALSQMVDPALRGLYPPKSVSRFADIVALCVQREPEFRPPMSEVVQQLVRLVQSSAANMREDFGLGASRHSSAMSSRKEDLAASRRLTDF